MADPNTTPQDRIRIFDRNGFPLAEFRASVERSWVIGKAGRALFNYPSRKTDVVNEKVLQFGNWILVENSQLPPWVGVIDTPRHWTARQVAVHAYTPERVFSWRRGPLEERLTGSAGTIFENLLAKVNAAEATIISAGQIWRGGAQRSETLNPTALNDDLKRLVERSGETYRWRPVVNELGKLVVFADWLENIGVQTGSMLQEGKHGGNVESVSNLLVEDEEIFNDILGYGEGLTWNTRPIAVLQNNESMGKYGLRQKGFEFSGVSEIATLVNNTQQKLSDLKQPLRTFHLYALNVGDTFKFINLGFLLKLRLQSAGFFSGSVGYETNIRIIGMAYDPQQSKNKIELTVEEII